MGEAVRYRGADVASRNGRNNNPLWVVYKDGVYDLTSYVYEHPGGPDLLQEVAGKDATKDFDAVGHSSDARAVMAKFKVGELIEEEKQYDANGKKKKKVVEAQPEKEGRSCLSMVTCGLIG